MIQTKDGLVVMQTKMMRPVQFICPANLSFLKENMPDAKFGDWSVLQQQRDLNGEIWVAHSSKRFSILPVGFSESDNSPAAQSARKINGIGDLDGIEFVAKITTKKDQNEELRNEIRFAITPDHKDYQSFMVSAAPIAAKAPTTPAAPAANNRPAWAR